MGSTNIVTRKSKHFTVAELVEFLKDCRPDAEIYVSYECGEDKLSKVRKVNNGGNYVQLVYSQ